MRSKSAQAKSQVRRGLQPARRLAARFTATDAVGLPAPGTVRPGSRPRRVKTVQRMVNGADVATLSVDGVYGPATHEAVRALQRKLRLPVTGLADPMTVSAGLVHAEGRRRDAADQQRRKQDETRRTAAARPRRLLLKLPVPPPSEDAAARRVPLRHLILEAPQHQYLPRKLEQSGLCRFESETTACFLALLEHLGPVGQMFDVGANIGPFSHLAQAVMGWDVVAFEPTPDLAATVRRAAEANSLTTHVEERAIGRTAGAATFYLSDKSDLSSSLNPDFRESTYQLTVPVETLDDYVARSGLVPSVLKVDAESTDADVLGGAQRLIEEHRPWIIVEVLDEATGVPIHAEIERFGYSLYPLHESRLPMKPEPQFTGNEDGRPWNWLLAPEPLPDSFNDRVLLWRESVAECGPVTPAG
jgi:FkbM family methyltransferase